jgi:hypothetical protein
LGAALLVAALIAGCGSSSPPSRADYGKDVDKICKTLEDRVDAIQRTPPSSTDDLVKYADELGQVLDDGVRELDAVKRPAGDDGVKAQRWLDELRRQAAAAKPALAALKDAARRKDPAAIKRAIQRVQAIDSRRVDDLARAAGARGCAT